MDAKELEMKKRNARRIGVGLGKVADTLDAHKQKVGDIEINMRGGKYIDTSGSFGGLFAVLSKSKEELENKDLNYGKELIAKECGLTFGKELKFWAKWNPRLWGNLYGASMFHHQRAFGITEGDNNTLPLNTIIAHLRGVSARCAELKA